MPNMFENSNQPTPQPFSTHYGVKHHLQTIIITKNFINNLQYWSTSGCEHLENKTE